MSEHDHRDGGREDASSPPRRGAREPTLPPPAFPPGTRRTAARRDLQHDDLRDAFLSSDDSFHTGEHADAFLSPDDPFPPRTSHREEPVDDEGDDEDFDPEEVVVTGIGDDPHLDPLELSPGGDPYVMELAEQVGKLAEAIRRRGEAGLQTLPGMTTFEGTLRAYCVGYLRGRRTKDAQG